MINLFDILVKKEREIIIEEKDVMTTLKAWNDVKNKSRFHNNENMELGCCESTNSATKWISHFKASEKQWKDFIKEINKKNHKLILMDDNKIYVT
jgi:hypothetical protein